MVRKYETVPKNTFAPLQSHISALRMLFAVVRGQFSISERAPHHYKVNFQRCNNVL